jgi:methionyl aminopeptidase
MISIKSEKEIQKMREIGKIVARAHEEIKKHIKIGVTTKELDKVCEDFFLSHGCNCSCKGYPQGDQNPFPATACISVNDEVIHGIPGNRKLKDGDLVCVDIVADKNGYFGDATRCYVVGNGSEVAKKLVQVAEKSFWEGIKYAKEGYRVSDISHAIQEYVEKNGFSVVREFQGHGIGTEMHEDPGVPNYGPSGKGPRLQAGMTIAVEPMINEGLPDVFVDEDGWTVYTEDGKLSAHYENTILITKNGAEVLTIV